MARGPTGPPFGQMIRPSAVKKAVLEALEVLLGAPNALIFSTQSLWVMAEACWQFAFIVVQGSIEEHNRDIARHVARGVKPPSSVRDYSVRRMAEKALRKAREALDESEGGDKDKSDGKDKGDDKDKGGAHGSSQGSPSPPGKPPHGGGSHDDGRAKDGPSIDDVRKKYRK